MRKTPIYTRHEDYEPSTQSHTLSQLNQNHNKYTYDSRVFCNDHRVPIFRLVLVQVFLDVGTINTYIFGHHSRIEAFLLYDISIIRTLAARKIIDTRIFLPHTFWIEKRLAYQK